MKLLLLQQLLLPPGTTPQGGRTGLPFPGCRLRDARFPSYSETAAAADTAAAVLVWDVPCVAVLLLLLRLLRLLVLLCVPCAELLMLLLLLLLLLCCCGVWRVPVLLMMLLLRLLLSLCCSGMCRVLWLRLFPARTKLRIAIRTLEIHSLAHTRDRLTYTETVDNEH